MQFVYRRLILMKLLKTTIILLTTQDVLRNCTVHVDSIKSFICPTNAHKLL